jgi:WD40 repeat protein
LAVLRHNKNERVRSARFSQDGKRVVTASWDGTAKVWSSDHGAWLATLHHAARVESADFSPDGRYVATASEDRTARIWSTESGRQIGEPLRHGDGVYTVQFSPPNTNLRILTASQDGTARIWDASAGSASEITLHHEKEVHLAFFSQQGDRVFTAQGDTARIWDVKTGQPVGDMIQNGSWIKLARFAPDGQRLATFAPDGKVRLWLWDKEISGWKMVGSLYLGTMQLPALQFTKDGQRLMMIGGNGRIQIWDVQNGQLLPEGYTPFPELASVNLAAFDPSGTRAALVSGFTLYLWDLDKRRPLGPPRKYEGFNVTSIEFQSNGQRLAVEYKDGMVRIWDMNKPDAVFERRSKGEEGEEVKLLRFSPDGKLLAVVSGSEVRMYDSEQGKLLHKRISHVIHDKSYKILGLAFPDSRRLATAAEDGTVRLWDAMTGDPIARPFRHSKEVRTVEFSPDGQRMVTSSADRTARLWEVPTWRGSPEDAQQLASLAELACGNQLNESNELEPVSDLQARLDKLQKLAQNSSPLAPFLRWFLAPPSERTLSPNTKLKVEDYVRQQLATGLPEDREEARQVFPDSSELKNAEKEAEESLKPKQKEAKPREPRRGPRDKGKKRRAVAPSHRAGIVPGSVTSGVFTAG